MKRTVAGRKRCAYFLSWSWDIRQTIPASEGGLAAGHAQPADAGLYFHDMLRVMPAEGGARKLPYTQPTFAQNSLCMPEYIAVDFKL